MTWKRILLLFVGFFLFLLGATYVVLQETGAAQTFIRATLSRLIAAEFFLRDAFVNLAEGRITIEDFEVTDPTRTRRDHLVRAQRVDLEWDTNPLGKVLSVQQVNILGLDIKLDLAAERLPTLSELLHLPEREAADTGIYPPVTISESTLELGVGRHVPPLRFTDIELRLRPQERDSNVMVLSGTALCENFGVELEVNGEGQVQKGQFRGFAKAAAIEIGSTLLHSIRGYLPQLPEDAQIEGTATRGILWFEYGSANRAGLAGGMNVEITGLRCVADTLVYPIEGANLKVSASTREEGKVKFSLEQRSAKGDLAVTGSLANLWREPIIEIRCTGRDLLVGPELQRAATSFEAGRNLWSAFAPSGGRIDAEAHIRKNAGMARPDVQFDLDLKGVALTFHGLPAGEGRRKIAFPLPLVDTRGRISLRRGAASLHEVSAEVEPEAGGGRVELEGMVFLETNELPAAVQLDIRCPGITFSTRLRDALGILVSGGDDLFDQFAPQGSAAVSVRIRSGRPDATWQVRIRPLGASATYRAFPYRIDGVHGLVEVGPQGVVLDLQGMSDEMPVALEGRLLPDGNSDALEPANWRSELWIQAQHVPFDAELRHAAGVFSSELEDLWGEYSPGGRGNLELVMWREAGAEDFSYDVRVDLEAASALSQAFPLETRDLYGSIFVHGNGPNRRIELNTVQGSILSGGIPGRLSLVGAIVMDQRGRTDDITAILHDLDLSHELASALDRIGGFRMSAWEVLKPSGTVDVVLRRYKPPEAAESDIRLVVQLRGVRSDARMLPRPATDLRGEIVVINGNADFRNLHARMGNSEVVCKEGYVRQHRDPEAPRTEVRFTVASDRFPVDDNLCRLFDGPLRQAVLDRRLRGEAKINSMTLTFLVPLGEGAEGFETRLTGQFEALGVEMLLGTRVDAINGLITVTDSWFEPGSGWITGSIDSGSFRLFGHPLVDMKSRFHADAERMTLTDLSLSVHDGFVRSRDPEAAALRYELADHPDEVGILSLDLEVEGLSLSEFLRAQGMPNTGYHGTIYGNVEVERLRGADFVDMVASGSIAVTDGNLGGVPLFRAIYGYLRAENRPRFDNAVVDLDVRDGRITLDDLAVRSPLVTVTGNGIITMEVYVDVTLQVDNIFGASADVLVLPPLIHAITSQILSFHVYGYPHDLRTEQRWFTQDHPRRPLLGPVPPRRDPVQRPDY